MKIVVLEDCAELRMLAVACGDPEHEPWLRAFLSAEPIDADAYLERLRAPARGWTFAGAESLAEADALVVERTSVDPSLLERAPRLRTVVHLGALLDAVDVDACAAREIEVVAVARRTTASVADHTLMLMLALVRRLEGDARIRPGDPPGVVVPSTEEGGHAPTVFNWKGLTGLRALEELRLVLLGGGDIAHGVARRALACGMEIGYWARRPRPQLDAAGAQRLSLEEAPAWADVASVHLAYAPELHHVVDAAFLERLGPRGYLVNAARGLLVDQEALIAALHAGTIAGAALDVFAEEPPARPEELLAAPNLIATPHVGASSRWSLLADVTALASALPAPVAT